MKLRKRLIVLVTLALLAAAAPAGAQTNPSCTLLDVARRALPIMRQYLMQQYRSAAALLTEISQAAPARGRVQSYVKRQGRQLELRLSDALGKFEGLPKDTYFCTDPTCYNVSLQESLNDFRLASSRISELHESVGLRYASLIGSTPEAVAEQAQRNLMLVMDATDYYPMMTMVCP